MRHFLKLGNDGFRSARNGEYVDKSGLIEILNSTLNSESRFTCVSRARRFGKSMAAKMLYAYYDQWCDSSSLFSDLEIASSKSFLTHFHRYPVIYLDMTDFVSRYQPDNIVEHISKDVIAELNQIFPQCVNPQNTDLLSVLSSIAGQPHQEKFIMIIDEWDAILREWQEQSEVIDAYINLLRGMFKSVSAMSVFAGVYMTGILPIKKYNTQSALNNFREYSMIEPGPLAPYFGFTASEVRRLCESQAMSYEQLAEWYDGYMLGREKEMFNPTSVMTAVFNNYCGNYWASTGTYETIATYIRMNFDGLRDDVLRLLAGESCAVEPTGFSNDLNKIRSKDDVLTLLIHLGYLSYNREEGTCHIPNREVAAEFKNAIVTDSNWGVIAQSIMQSDRLLQDTIAGQSESVANLLDQIHEDNTSILQYNDENSLACVLTLAYYSARKDYIVIRELPTGKGFADIVLLPRPTIRKPAILLELKYNQSADSAINQIHERRYGGQLKDFAGEVVLVGVNYDRQTKQHTCVIEKMN